ncbi:MAG: hypothetical protein ACRECA_14295, partial [Pseudolabrys sp.]
MDKNANRNLVRIFSICLSTLVLSYSTLALRHLFESATVDVALLFMTAVRVSLGAAALFVMFNPTWLARPLHRHVDAMGRLFEAGYE